MLWIAVAVALIAQATGENLASCANTLCTGTKVCKIIERCWGKDCQVGTTCIEPTDLPAGSGHSCLYDSPLLSSQDGGAISEIQCGPTAVNSACPAGSTCVDLVGVCCTGAMKNTGSCPAKPSHYYLSRGSCKTFCRHDQECPGFQRCCDTGACKACVDPVPVSTCETFTCGPDHHCIMTEDDCFTYPCFAMPTCIQNKGGQCPLLDKQATCSDQCKVDSHCPDTKKCCSAGGCNVCADPSSFSSSFSFPSSTPSPNFNGGFNGLGGTLDPFAGSLPPTTTPGSPGLLSMSGFLGSDGSSTGSGIDTSGGAGSATGLAPSTGLLSDGSSATNPFSNMLTAMKSMQDGANNSPGTTSMTSMMDALRKIQSGGSTGSTSIATALSNFRNMMSNLNTGGTSAPTLGGLGGSGGGTLSSLSGFGSTGGGGLDPVLSGNTLQTLGGGGFRNLGGGGGLAPTGLNPRMPSLGGASFGGPSRNSMNAAPQQRRGRFKCPMCMMMMMMPS